ncbi:MAG: DUF3820 family protein [Rhodoferax sp.]|nr:DUF3820 family protein [Rhodoferax sp.]
MQAHDLQKLVDQSMPFGKYQGRRIADLPGDYLHWFARTGFPRGEMGRLLQLMHEIDHNGLRTLLAPLRAGGQRPAAKAPAEASRQVPGARFSKP